MRALRLEDRAEENLRFIRATMERAGAFTAVPGRGMVAIGITAVVAAALAPAADGPSWLRWWLAEAVVAVTIGAWALVRKARGLGLPLLSGPGRRFFLAFSPPLGGARR